MNENCFIVPLKNQEPPDINTIEKTLRIKPFFISSISHQNHTFLILEFHEEVNSKIVYNEFKSISIQTYPENFIKQYSIVKNGEFINQSKFAINSSFMNHINHSKDFFVDSRLPLHFSENSIYDFFDVSKTGLFYHFKVNDKALENLAISKSLKKEDFFVVEHLLNFLSTINVIACKNLNDYALILRNFPASYYNEASFYLMVQKYGLSDKIIFENLFLDKSNAALHILFRNSCNLLRAQKILDGCSIANAQITADSLKFSDLHDIEFIHKAQDDHEKQKEHEKQQDYEKQKEHEKQQDYEKQKEHEKQQDYEKQKEHEKQQDYEKQKEHEKQQDYEKPKFDNENKQDAKILAELYEIETRVESPDNIFRKQIAAMGETYKIQFERYTTQRGYEATRAYIIFKDYNIAQQLRKNYKNYYYVNDSLYVLNYPVGRNKSPDLFQIANLLGVARRKIFQNKEGEVYINFNDLNEIPRKIKEINGTLPTFPNTNKVPFVYLGHSNKQIRDERKKQALIELKRKHKFIECSKRNSLNSQNIKILYSDHDIIVYHEL